MLVEKKSNIFDSIAQIVKIVQNEVDNYTKVGCVRTVNSDGTYDVELMSDQFDINKTNPDSILNDVINVTNLNINIKSYVYLTAISKRMFVIIAATNVNNVDIISTETIKTSTINHTQKFEESYKITDKDDNAIINVVPDKVDLTADTLTLTGKGGKVEITDKLSLSNQVSSLKEILDGLITTLNTNVVPDCTLVTPYGAGTGVAFAGDLVKLKSKIGGLLK